MHFCVKNRPHEALTTAFFATFASEMMRRYSTRTAQLTILLIPKSLKAHLMPTTRVKVIIPLYTTRLTPYEERSLHHNCQQLSAYPIVFITPRGLDLTAWLKRYPQCRVETFDPAYFSGISGYNRLMMSTEFYTRFTDTEYLLICQTDAYVFRGNELADWCERGYDYIGAPWPVKPIYRFPPFRLASSLKRRYYAIRHRPDPHQTRYRVGNGGLSLRRVASHLHAVSALHTTVEQYLNHPGFHLYNEDVFFAVEPERHGLAFRYPQWQEALQFSFDKYPALCYRLNGRQLPFGCHAWYKRKMKRFWFPIILSDSRP